MILLLMAAGSGSRYGKLKQFDELGPKDEFLMEFSIHDALKYGFTHIVVITKAANKDFLQNYLSERLPENIKLDVLVQDINDIPEGVNVDTTNRQKPWGTAHAVWTARNVIDNDFAIINADDYYGQNAFKAISSYLNGNKLEDSYGLVGYDLKDTLSDFGSVSRGVCKVENGKLTSIEELTKIERVKNQIIDNDSGKVLTPETIVSMNFWVCSKSIFNYISSYFKTFIENSTNLEKSEIYIPFVIQEMMNKNIIDIDVIDANSKWFGVTYYDDKKEAVNTLKELTNAGIYPSPLWK